MSEAWDKKYSADENEVRARLGAIRAGLESSTLRELLKEERTHARVLEIGCGTGQHSVALALARSEWTITATDPSTVSVEEARALGIAGGTNVLAQEADTTKLPYPDASFDIVFGDHVVGHILDYQAAFRECARVLAPGGVLVVNGANALRPDGWPFYHALTEKTYFRRAFLPWTLAGAARGAGLRFVRSYGSLLWLRRGFDLLFRKRRKVASSPTASPRPRAQDAKRALERLLPAWLLVEYGIVARKPV